MVFLAFLDFLRVILLCFFRVPPKIFLDTILIGANGPAIALAAFAAAFALAFSAFSAALTSASAAFLAA